MNVDLIFSFFMFLIKAGCKTPSAKTLAAGLEKSTKPPNESNLAALASPFSTYFITAQSPAAAVDQLIGNSVALQECERRSVRETSERASTRRELCEFTRREPRIPASRSHEPCSLPSTLAHARSRSPLHEPCSPPIYSRSRSLRSHEPSSSSIYSRSCSLRSQVRTRPSDHQHCCWRSTLGATFRPFFGAGLSMFDFVTDALM